RPAGDVKALRSPDEAKRDPGRRSRIALRSGRPIAHARDGGPLMRATSFARAAFSPITCLTFRIVGCALFVRTGRESMIKYSTGALFLALSVSAALAGPESEISAYRKIHGLSAVTVDPALNALAAKQADAMAASGVMDHSVYAAFGQRISAYNT